jgi:hypothetical protein
VALGLTLRFLLLPGGRLRSRGWRVVVATAVTGAGLVLAAGSLIPGRLGETSIANPFALAGVAGTVATGLFDAGLALHAGSLLAAVVSLVLGFRTARAVPPAAPLGRRRRYRRPGRAAADHPRRPRHRAEGQ